MDEKLLNRVLEIEKEAQEIHESALNEALEVPVRAEKKVQELMEKIRLEAEGEAEKIVSRAQAKEECDRIMANAEENIEHNEKLAKANLNRAVAYVIGRVIGRE